MTGMAPSGRLFDQDDPEPRPPPAGRPGAPFDQDAPHDSAPPPAPAGQGRAEGRPRRPSARQLAQSTNPARPASVPPADRVPRLLPSGIRVWGHPRPPACAADPTRVADPACVARAARAGPPRAARSPAAHHPAPGPARAAPAARHPAPGTSRRGDGRERPGPAHPAAPAGPRATGPCATRPGPRPPAPPGRPARGRPVVTRTQHRRPRRRHPALAAHRLRPGARRRGHPRHQRPR